MIDKIKSLLINFLKNPFIKTPLLAIAIVLVAGLVFFLFLHVFTRHGQGFPVPDFTGLNKQQSIALAKQKRIRIEISDSVYIMTREPGSVISQNPSPGLYVKANRRIFLTTNAINPQLVEMPNVVGVTLRQAKSILDLKGFTIGNLSFKPDIAINNVLEQRYMGNEVEPGELIPKGSTINLVLGRGLYNEKTVLPRVIGLTLADARNLLLDASLNMGKTKYDETVLDFVDSLNARVYSQYPNPMGETTINFGSRVDLWLTLNESRIPPPPEPEIKKEEKDSLLFVEPDEEIFE
jgi:beta-lactam-binding protein with PASTA domain